jgi:hypothetical protein
MATKTTVTVKELDIRTVVIPIKGRSPLIVNQFNKKARDLMLDKQTGKATNKKHAIKVPENDYEGSKHISTEGWEGFPAAGFKGAMIRAAKSLGMVMTDVRTAFFIQADDELTQLVRIYGESRMREDMVRVGMGTADIRFRAEYPQWEANLTVEFNEGNISIDQIYQLVKMAGYGSGIGEMRPEKGKFNYGRFVLAQEVQTT